MQNSTQILLGSLKHVLPENRRMDAGEIIQAAFEELHLAQAMTILIIRQSRNSL